MPFSTIKILLLEASGRHDLFETSGTTLLNALAKAATQYLDLRFGESAGIAESWYKKDVVAGTVLLQIPGVRSISEVWITDSEGVATQLVKMNFKDMKVAYPEQSTDIDQGQPIYYAILAHKLAPSQHTLTALANTDFTNDDEFTLYGNQVTQKAIAIMPPPDATYTVSVKGVFFSAFPTADADENFWITNFPIVFVNAIMRELEIFYRNFEGARTWTAAINEVLGGVDNDLAEQDSTAPSVMEG